MSIMTDARLRLLEARIAEIERRLAERRESAPEASAAIASPMVESAKKSAPKPRKRSRKTP